MVDVYNVCVYTCECACVCDMYTTVWQCTQHTCDHHTNSWLHACKLTFCLHFCISIKGSRVNSQYVCSARMYHGHYHAIISHPTKHCTLIQSLSLSLSLSLTHTHAHAHTHTHTHTFPSHSLLKELQFLYFYSWRKQRGNSSLPRKLMIVSESLFFSPLSLCFLSLSLPLSSHSVTHTHTHTAAGSQQSDNLFCG